MSNILKLNLTDQQRSELKLEFDQLKTVDEKLDFWYDKLKIDFSNFDQCEMYDIQDFWIEPTNENEFEFVNTRNLDHYKLGLQFVEGKNRFQDFEERKEAFLKIFENIPNKDSFINEEIRKLNSFIDQEEIKANQSPNSRSRFLIATYKQYIESGIVQIWNNKIVELGNLIESDKGLTLAKYKEFLEDYRSPKKPELKKTYSHAVQILILDYLGFHKDLVNTKKAKLYSPIINRDIETTRQLFSEINNYKTLNNLNLILSYFTELGFSEQIQIVKKDIVRAKKEK